MDVVLEMLEQFELLLVGVVEGHNADVVGLVDPPDGWFRVCIADVRERSAIHPLLEGLLIPLSIDLAEEALDVETHDGRVVEGVVFDGDNWNAEAAGGSNADHLGGLFEGLVETVAVVAVGSEEESKGVVVFGHPLVDVSDVGDFAGSQNN